MARGSETRFDVDEFLATAGPGRKIVQLKRAEAFFSQGDPADRVFYLQRGRAEIPSHPQPARKRQSDLFQGATFSVRRRWQPTLDCD